MRKDRETAFKLRLGGKSYSEIGKILGTPKSTLSGWFYNLVLSEDLKKKIESRARRKSFAGLLRRNKNQTKLAQLRAENIRKQSASEISILSKKDLFLSGIVLYWAEGYKRAVIKNGRELTSHPVSLTNSDPYIIKMFLRFLREYCMVPEDKIKASIRIFQHQNEKTLLSFWRKETGILTSNFNKTYYGISKSSLHKRPFNQLPYGVIQVVVADTKLFHRIMGYIEGIKKMM